MVPIVATETAWKIRVAEIVWIGSPDYFVVWKNAVIVDCGKGLPGRLDIGGLLAISPRIVLFVEGRKTCDDFLSGFLVTAISGLDLNATPVFLTKGRLDGNPPCRDGFVNRAIRSSAD